MKTTLHIYQVIKQRETDRHRYKENKTNREKKKLVIMAGLVYSIVFNI